MDTEIEKEIEKHIYKQNEPNKQSKQSRPSVKKFVVNTDDGVFLNVRSAPTMLENNVVGTLAKGTLVTGHGENGEFTKITFNGKTAYVLTSKLKEK